jgi:TatA/E family protein of Tat protein translocase
MGPLGWQETVFIFVLALLIFGPKKLPELGRTIGKALTEFRRASSELKATFDREMSSIERENESLKEVTSSYQSDLHNNYDYNYDSSYYDGESGSSASSDSTASDTSTVGASASQGAESSSGVAPEGTLAASLGEEAAGTPSNGTGLAAEQSEVDAQAGRSVPAADFQI